MATPQTTVVHLLAADVAPDRLAVLRALHACDEVASRQIIVQVGTGTPPAGIRPTRVHAPFGWGWLGAHMLRRELRLLGVCTGGGALICHVWSSGALAWCGALPDAAAGLLIEVETGSDVVRLVQRSLTIQPAGTRCFVCADTSTRQQLLGLGVVAGRCTIVDPFVDFAALAATRGADARARLRLHEDDVVVALLPPIARRAGSLAATWAALLVEKVRADVRLLVPAGGREGCRVRRLINDCRHERIVRYADEDLALPELLAAADLCVFLPAEAAPLSAPLWAMAAGRPLVASAVPTMRTLLRDCRGVWLCRPDDPEDAARQMLDAIEATPDDVGPDDGAQTEFRTRHSRGRMVAAYRRLYEGLAASG